MKARTRGLALGDLVDALLELGEHLLALLRVLEAPGTVHTRAHEQK